MSEGERETELAEYQAIQMSRLFSGETNSKRFLKFVCDKHFAGICQVSEKEVAIEAFGRRPDFDPQQDSIVRVEAHRVRKRLSEYYAAEEASHSIRLTIPQGTYMPHFVTVPKEEDTLAPPAQAVTETESSDDSVTGASHTSRGNERETGRRPAKMRILAISLLVGVALAVILGLHLLLPQKGQVSPGPVLAIDSPVPPALSSEVLIMAGSSAKSYTDQLGHVWSGDRYYKGGEPWAVSYRHISRTDDPQLFLTSRQGRDFVYEIPLPPGLYELRLYFAETFYGGGNREGGGESSRIFDVIANGAPILTEFDPLSDAGGSNTADIRVFSGVSPAADGKLHLEFQSRWQLKSIASVNAIQIVRTGRRSMMPIRLVAADSAIEDQEGNLWLPDQSVEGGRRREFTETVTNTNDPELYQSERYGNFSYAIPVSANNTYTLTLHFSEHWWGIPDFGGPPDAAIGRRVFDVFCNGVYLLQDYDIFKQAGGSLRAVSVTVHGIKPNHQGKIQLSFVPAKHYASIDALEIKPEHEN
jgi:hypothetical protein